MANNNFAYGSEIFARLTGTGQFFGDETNVINYSYTEGSTPLVPGDESGAIGDITIDVLDKNETSILVYKDDYLLQDNFHGSVVGTIENVSGSNDVVSMGGRSKLALLNIDTIIPPRSGSIGNIIEDVVNELGITQNVIKDAGLSSATINVPGYEGDAWVYIKRLCSAHSVEVAIIREYLIIRPVRQRTISGVNLTEKNWQLQDIELAQEFDVAYYNYVPRTNYLVYPEGGWTPDVQVYQVAANETTEFELDLNFYLTSVQQPTVRDSVSKNYTAQSAYSASGNDNLPVSAAFWTQYGGDMSFEILGDGSRLRVTITGPNYEPLSPYTIGVSDGSTSYSTLRIVGTGMDFDRQIYTCDTGLSPSDTPIVKGQEIDNPAIDTLDDAKQYALFARRLYSLPTQTYSTSSNTFPRLVGSIPSIFYTTFDQFNEQVGALYTFSDFNDEYDGLSFSDLTVLFGSIAPQGFGEVAGSRIKLDDAIYRVRSTTITPGLVSFDSEYDTLFSDINESFGDLSWSELAEEWASLTSTWSGVIFEWSYLAGIWGSLESSWSNIIDYVNEITFDRFNDIFDGLTFRDYALIPLRREAI